MNILRYLYLSKLLFCLYKFYIFIYLSNLWSLDMQRRLKAFSLEWPSGATHFTSRDSVCMLEVDNETTWNKDLSIYLSISLFIYLSIYLSIYIYLFIYFCLSIYLYIYQSIYLSHLSVSCTNTLTRNAPPLLQIDRKIVLKKCI